MVRRSFLGLVLAVVVLCPVVVQEGAIAAPISQAQDSEFDRAFNEGMRLFREGSKESLEKAIKWFEKAFEVARLVRSKEEQAFSLLALGRVNDALGKKQKALDFYNQALPLYRAAGDRSGEATTLNNIGLVNDALGKKQKALDFYNRALPLYRAAGDRSGEATTLNNIGSVYSALGKKQKALNFFNQALLIYRAVGNRSGEAATLHNIGRVYSNLGQKQKALEFYNQALSFYQVIGNSGGEATALNNMGIIYSDLGEKQKALDFYNQALPLYRVVGDREGEATALSNIGRIYDALGEKQKALNFYNKVLSIYRLVGNRSGEATTLHNIGSVYSNLNEKQKALNFYNQALSLDRAVGNRSSEAATLNNMGIIYSDLGEKQKALDFCNQALLLSRAVDNRSGEATTLSNIGLFLQQQNQLERAIAFYKKSVNIYEFLRTQIDTLPRSTQERYTRTISGTYRRLANVLIQQNRFSEAQQVLELLKLREIKELKPNQSDLKTPIREIPISDNEKQSIAQISPEAAKDITPTALLQHDRLSPTNPLNQSAQNLLNAQPNSALIYHLITENQLWILLATPDGKLQRFSSKIKQNEIEALNLEFRQKIKQCEKATCEKADTQQLNTTSQRIYQQIFPPDLQAALQKANVKHLTLALDGSLRNIPIATLHTGQAYLIQQYSISQIIAAQLTDSQAKLPKQFPVLAAGASNFATIPLPAYVRSEKEDFFSALPGVKVEVTAIVGNQEKRGILPGKPLLNDQFTLPNLQTHIPNYPIVHIATHGIFRPNFLNYSYLLLGNGKPWIIAQIDTDTPNLFRNTHLVTLSACQTGVGDKDNTGMEIAGMSYAFMSQGAKSVIASLWNINDPSTALFMQQFYIHLTNGKTKAQAIQQVQQDFIDRKLTPKEANALRGAEMGIDPNAPIPTTILRSAPADYTHPYYWAPFILIGNNL